MPEEEGQTPHSVEPVEKKLCRNCEAELQGGFCHVCGQHGLRSRRLNTRGVFRDFFERIFNLESSFLKTLIGLTLRPGSVCSEYVEGKRKRYTNPFAYFVLAAAIGVFLTGIDSSATTVPSEELPPEFLLKYFSQLGLIGFIPLAFLWSKLFRRAERNLAENYVFSLFTFGHFLWCEVLLLGPLTLLIPSDMAIGVTYVIVFVGYLVFAGTVFYQEKPHIVIMKLLVSFVVLALAAAFVLLPLWINDV